MSNARFEQFKSNMQAVGLEIDSRIEQRESDGVLGMYANDNIPAGACLAKFPLNSRIPALDGYDFGDKPNAPSLSAIHAIAKALSSEDSPYKSYFEYSGSLQDRKEKSACFFEEEDFEQLHKMNVMVAKQAFYVKAEFLANVKAIHELDPDLDTSFIEHALVIWKEKCWGPIGFLPGIDLFNHNTASLLSPRVVELEGEQYAVIEAASDIASGDQIYVTFGKKDAFQFLTQYDYYDETDMHLMTYSARVEQEVKDDFVGQVVNLLKKTYDVLEYERDGKPFFKVNEPNAFFLEQGPNTKMVELASRLSVSSDEQILTGQTDTQATSSYLLQILLAYKKVNKIGEISINTLPEKFHPYHRMLTREMAVIDQNIEVVKARLFMH